jgi:hypothetical protein
MKKLLIPTLGLAALIGLGVLGISSVKADDETTSSPIVEKLVSKFNLNEDEVVGVFNELRDEKRAEMQAAREERLSEAVSDGVITEEQKQALISKWQEMETKREQERQEMQAWFEEQGIDMEALRQYEGFGRGPGPMHMGF